MSLSNVSVHNHDDSYQGVTFDEYVGYEVDYKWRFDGVEITYRSMPEAFRARDFAIIKGQLTLWEADMKVLSEFDRPGGNVTIRATFVGAPTPERHVQLDGRTGVLKAVTSWGGRGWASSSGLPTG